MIGGAINGKKSYDEGNRGWDLAGSIAEGVLLGGAFGAAAGALIGLAPTIGTGLGAMIHCLLCFE